MFDVLEVSSKVKKKIQIILYRYRQTDFVSVKKRQHHISFIIKRNKLLAIGFNDMSKTHPLSNTPYKRIHSELDAVLQCRLRPQEFRDLAPDMLNVRMVSEGFANSKPCACCLSLLRYLGFRSIYFTQSAAHDLGCIKL